MNERVVDRSPSLARFAVIVLAAGASRRFGAGNKLIAPYRGQPLISHVLLTVDRLDVHRRILVTGPPYRYELVNALQAHPGWHEVVNAEAFAGMGSSIAAGAAHLSGTSGVFVCPGDMPGILPRDFSAVASLMTGAESICRPRFEGRPGHPVLFGAAYYARLRMLGGIRGARDLLESVAARVVAYEACHAGVVRDLDLPEHFT